MGHAARAGDRGWRRHAERRQPALCKPGAQQVSVGLSRPLFRYSETTVFADVGYRFLDLGPITGISPVTGTTVTQRIRANELRAGIRYMID